MKHFNGRRLYMARLVKRWSVPELVYQIRRLTGVRVSAEAIRAHEGGRLRNPGAQILAAYAAALGVEPGAFFTGRQR